jgi:hypothetical protein
MACIWFTWWSLQAPLLRVGGLYRLHAEQLIYVPTQRKRRMIET